LKAASGGDEIEPCAGGFRMGDGYHCGAAVRKRVDPVGISMCPIGLLISSWKIAIRRRHREFKPSVGNVAAIQAAAAGGSPQWP
jgi:hypothetical protein